MLNELLQESGFVHKFDHLEGKLRRSTVGEMKALLKAEYDATVVLQPADDIPPMQCASASVDHPNRNPVITLEVGRKVKDTTRVSLVQGLLDNIRHEVQHIHQLRDIGEDENYQMPRGDVESQAKYTYQYMERSPQAIDLCTALAAVGSNPDDFKKMVQDTIRDLDEREEDPRAFHMASHSTVLDHLGHEKIHGHIENDNSRYVYVLQHHVAVMSMAKALMKLTPNRELRSELRNKTAAFLRLVRNKFPSVRAYQRKHASERPEFDKKAGARSAELQHAEDTLDLMLAKFIKNRAA